MGKLKPIERMAEDCKNGTISSDDVVMLELGNYTNGDMNAGSPHHPVGYISRGGKTKSLDIYPTSGLATTHSDEMFKKLRKLRVDISKGNYLGREIINYEVIRKGMRDE